MPKGVTPPPFVVTRKRPIILPSKLLDPQEFYIKKDKSIPMAPNTPDGPEQTNTLDVCSEDNREMENLLVPHTSPSPTLMTPTWPSPNLPPSPMARPSATRNLDRLENFNWDSVGRRGAGRGGRGRGRGVGGTAGLSKPHSGGKKIIRYFIKQS